ncbi:MAG: Rrf2 family transcriptional regulator [Castellaniella sp.]|nr:Rrf2 family transcriptional regulator [Castellaniella sp.]
MRLTNMSDYAVRLLMYLSDHRDRLCTIAEIAQFYGISEPHLMKITHRLGQHGWIRTVRGKHGGMELAHEPRDIPLGALIRDMENDLALVECMGADNHCILTGHCGLKPVIAGALRAFMDYLDKHTLADVMPPSMPTQVTISSPKARARIKA